MYSRNILIAGFGALLAATAAGAGTARADCNLSIQPAQDQWLIQHDPFAGDALQRQFDVALVNLGDSPCTGSVRMDLRGEQYGLSKAGDPERVAYALIDERGGNDITPRTGQSARRLNAQPVNLGAGERSLVRFTFAADPEAMLGEGVYSQNVFIAVETADGAPVAERPVSLAINVIPAAVMGLKGEFQRINGVARIDLGELTEGSRPLGTSLFVLSTGGYRVSVQSSNSGRLRMGVSDWYVDYGLAVGSNSMSLGQGDDFVVTSNRPRADDYPLTVTVGDVRGRRAGEYSDVLTFTIAAL
ncbi:MAG: hypothetical protein KL785_02400 [Brevundimonas sp.]|nr:hypothetical protein [Brevundimonas sp.]